MSGQVWSPRVFVLFLSLLAVGLAVAPGWTLTALGVFVAARLLTAPSSASPPGPGPLTRPRRGPCPGCAAPQDAWCSPRCHLIDPMDYR